MTKLFNISILRPSDCLVLQYLIVQVAVFKYKVRLFCLTIYDRILKHNLTCHILFYIVLQQVVDTNNNDYDVVFN